ncbi:hypothetical protein LTR37_004701 [Vermiconidia calcicola]|uniref:Uncharacterized protein n=1 Tax=Vermiconidia calcicola TaxID=1690605 RepID=A0ACC3NLJ1_9PEZI|nr:hypothetical protein LTR37_004701 [Vermiconidia calcicola]
MDPSQEESVFDFFGLLRELRNMIYKNLTDVIEVRSGSEADLDTSGYQIVIHNAQIGRLLQLSRLFKSEYQDQLKRSQVVHMKDVGVDLVPPMLVRDLHEVVTAKVAILGNLTFASTCDDEWWEEGLYEISKHIGLIPNILKYMPNLRSWDIELYLHSTAATRQDWKQHPYAAEIRGELVDLTALPKLSTLEIHTFSFEDRQVSSGSAAGDAYDADQGVVAVWTPGSGWT